MNYKLVYFCNGEKHVLIGSFDDIKHCVLRLEQFDDIKCVCVKMIYSSYAGSLYK